MNDELFLLFYLCGILGVFIVLTAACSLFWRVFYAVKDFIKGQSVKRRTKPHRSGQARRHKKDPPELAG